MTLVKLAEGGEMESKRNRIVLVDDNAANLTIGRNLLKGSYEIYPAASAAKLFELLENVIPDLVLLDIEMPEMNGYEAIKILKADARFTEIPVIFLTSKNDEESEVAGFELGAADYVSKPVSGPLLLRRISNQLLIVQQRKELLANQTALKDYADHLVERVREKTAELLNLQSAVLATVADLVEFRDKQTGGHTTRTMLYMQTLIEEMLKDGIYTDRVSDWNIGLVVPSAQLHDVGKIAITDLILNKPGKLTEDEFEIMKTHVDAGVHAIERIMSEAKENAFLEHARLIVGSHHEKWNGSGYPMGLKGQEIPIEGRLMAIADVYDALISDRAYKKAFTHQKACDIIEESEGSHFDPALVGVFKNAKDEFERIALKYEH